MIFTGDWRSMTRINVERHIWSVVAAALIFVGTPLQAQAPAREPKLTASADIQDIRYDVTFDHVAAASRNVKVAMTFTTTGTSPVILSLPEWTPGAYEISNFARWVIDFVAKGDGRDLNWSKEDYDSWRVEPAGAKNITVSFTYFADSLDNAMAWAQRDF